MRDKDPPQAKDGIGYSIDASIMLANGNELMRSLRDKEYGSLIAEHKQLDKKPPRVASPEDVPAWLAAQLGVFKEAAVFSREDRFAIAMDSISLNAGNLRRTWSFEGKTDNASTGAYIGSIRALGFQELADTLEHWLKSGNGGMLKLYRGMRGCIPKVM
jgi:hypothetical protein